MKSIFEEAYYLALLFLDLEFNQGRNSNYFEIIQISVIKTDLFLEQIFLYDRLVLPTLATKVNKDVMRLTGISIKDLKYRGLPLERIIKEMKRNIFKGDITHIITWGNSDKGILESNCEKNNIDYSFLNQIEFVDMQRLYKSINNLKNDPSLHKVTSYMKFCKEHYGLHDVYRLIEVSKSVGIEKIFNSKNICIEYASKPSFTMAKKKMRKHVVCSCGESYLKIFLEGHAVELKNKEFEKIYLLRCRACTNKYKMITRSKLGIKTTSWIEDISEINNVEYFDEANKVIQSVNQNV